MFRNNELYGYDIHRSLRLQGVEIDLSRLYGILNDMRKKGLLNDRWEKSSSGPRKKMYSIAEKGKEERNEILLEAIATVHSFYGEYLQSLAPEINVFSNLIGFLTKGIHGDESLAYLTTKYFGIHEMILSILQKMIPEGSAYLVKPDDLNIKSNLENLTILNGEYNNIPFKNKFIDRLVIIDLPNAEILEESIMEWSRVLKENGGIAIITPTILLEKEIDPMNIGDFVEKYEHQIIEGGEHIDLDILLNNVEKYFKTINKLSAVHMTIINANDPLG
jgi:DNA-binding PadR family transcriptional regulator